MNRTDIINFLIDNHQLKSYLEIGVADGTNFDNIKCVMKVGVDPDKNSKATIFKTSDSFFDSNNQIFDLIFIDGLHHADQVYRDITNAINSLSSSGYIVCHDMLPPSEEYQHVPPVQNLWTGDCWKAWILLRSTRSDLSMNTVDTDFGCGIISKGSQSCVNVSKQQLTWLNYVQNKNHWMNIISIEEFRNIYKI